MPKFLDVHPLSGFDKKACSIAFLMHLLNKQQKIIINMAFGANVSQK